MRVTFVLLLCSFAAALASPTNGRFLDTLMDEQMDQGLHENDARQGQGNVPLKSYKEYLANFMQEDPCPVKPNCYNPSEYFVCGNDDRHVINNPENMIPNQWICQIKMESTGGVWYGTGFKVKISPDIGRTVLFTSGSTLRNPNGGYVPRLRIRCPGEAEVTVERRSDRDMWMSDYFIYFNRTLFVFDYDHGYITYPGNSNTGFGFQEFLDADAIMAADTQLHACGYTHPGLQDTRVFRCVSAEPKQFCAAGSLVGRHDYKLFANADFDSGQYGGPLYDATGDNFIAYGIVSQGGCPGRGYLRLTAEVLYNMFSHMGDIDMKFKMRGSHNVYLHMNGDGLAAWNRVGGNVYSGLLDNVSDTLYILPVKQSSSNKPDSQLVAIRSATQENIYLSLNGTGVTQYLLRGGGIYSHLSIRN